MTWLIPAEQARFKFQEYFVPVDGGWWASHIRVEVGSLQHYIVEQVMEMSRRDRDR